MPTGAKLTAAVLWGALAWFVSKMLVPYFPEGTDLGLFAEINAGFGVVIGWVVAGGRAGTTWSGAISYGLTATAALVFWGLFLHSFSEMIGLSLRKLYDGPVEALIGVFAIMVDHGQRLLHTDILVTLIVGGVVAGCVTEWVGRRVR